MAGQLQGKSCVVTGGNSGIGESIVLGLAAEGANIVIDYIAHPDAANQVVAEVEKIGGKAVAVDADVSKVDDLHKLIDAAVQNFGRLDIMVNNAGMETRTSLLDTSVENFESVVNVDLKSAFFGSQFAAKQFIEQGDGGVIINVSSVHEDWPMPGNIAYCVAKGGVKMLTRTAGVELGPHGIRMVNIAPGAVDTAINASEEANPADLAELAKTIPLGKMAEPDQIADVAVFIATGGSYLTATTITVDGGMTQASSGL